MSPRARVPIASSGSSIPRIRPPTRMDRQPTPHPLPLPLPMLPSGASFTCPISATRSAPVRKQLRISPTHTVECWTAAKHHGECAHGADQVSIFEEQIRGRYLSLADELNTQEFSGFAVLALDCLLIETLEQFVRGVPDSTSHSEEYFISFLAGKYCGRRGSLLSQREERDYSTNIFGVAFCTKGRVRITHEWRADGMHHCLLLLTKARGWL